MNQEKMEFCFEIDNPANNFPIAISENNPQKKFLGTNQIFSTVFPNIQTPEQLFNFINNDSDDKTILIYNEGYWEVITIQLNKNINVFLLRNISYEKLVLSKVKKQLTDLNNTYKFYAKIMDKELPIGVLIIDSHYNVQYVNHTLKKFFHIPSQIQWKKCYNYVKEIKPCKNCVFTNFQQTKNKNKKTYELEKDNRLITAELHPIEDKYILIFRDTTREIKLIKEIKRQRNELEKAHGLLTEQNNILKRLTNINIRIGQIKDLETILKTTIHAIINTFYCEKGAILLFNENGRIKDAQFSIGVSSHDQDAILKSIDGGDKNITNKSITKFSDDLSSLPIDGYLSQDMCHKNKTIGRVFLSKPQKEIDQSIMELFLSQVSNFLENLNLRRKLEELAQTDSLTGVFNRNYFESRFTEEKELSQRFGQPLSLILIDLNGLKSLNDKIGHVAGDLLLKETAQLLRDNISSYDSIYRVGGDEFILLLSNCPANHLQIMINMFKEMQTSISINYNGKSIPLRFSIGGACSTNFEHNKLKDIADQNMYIDKKEYYKTHKKYR